MHSSLHDSTTATASSTAGRPTSSINSNTSKTLLPASSPTPETTSLRPPEPPLAPRPSKNPLQSPPDYSQSPQQPHYLTDLLHPPPYLTDLLHHHPPPYLTDLLHPPPYLTDLLHHHPPPYLTDLLHHPPPYLTDLLHHHPPLYLTGCTTTPPSRCLRSSEANLLSIPTRTDHRTWGDRAFSVAAPSLWTSLPPPIRDLTSFNTLTSSIWLS
ncbi:hypothetical protein CgunFtcFv8_001414 [Champsocephalus gunnari]|uniref:Uncharacterized protein n=1 Tax=Champsocephalus gunnari TaxID=52237 RepID=A0AAN8CKV9_CHAGU|nr:hypothetical protein CgunFtcFv8_001414 [Champsocephalus gunnari]